MAAAEALRSTVGLATACRALGVGRAGLYRRRHPRRPTVPRPRPTPRRALTPAERQTVLATLHSERFVDQPPAAVYATLLDERRYLCSIRTMYRVLRAADEVRERRNQLRHPRYAPPVLRATGPNQVWSWDITQLRGLVKWTYYYLYVILDLFSRYAVGWMVAQAETSLLAERLLRETCAKHAIPEGQLTIHADRGPAMTSKPVALLLADLGVTRSHARPRVSNDNAFSEAQFKTLKYRPEFPDRFASVQDARGFCHQFFTWYNTEHHHAGLGLLTPAVVHYGDAEVVLADRQSVLTAAYTAHPERFVRQPPTPPALPAAVWINAPGPAVLELEARQ